MLALNVEAPELERWRECAALSDAEGRAKVREVKEAGEKGEKEEDVVLAAVARMRGWV